MECDVCKTKNKPVFLCDTCGSGLCKNCGNLSASEVKVLELKGERILRFDCSGCLKFKTYTVLQKTIEDKNEIIDSKEEIISLLRQRIQELESKEKVNNVHLPLYSEITKKSPNITQQTNIPSLIIKPKKKQNIEKIKDDLRRKINPAELKICVNNVKGTKDGNLLIKCRNKSDIELLKKEAEKKLNDYSVELTKLKDPRFKLIDYKMESEDELNKEWVKARIREQNNFIEDTDRLQINYIKLNRRTENYTIYGSCSAGLFHKFMAAEKIYIGWNRYPIYEDISIPRCFKCQGFYHKNSECPNKTACEYCSEEHPAKECPRNQKKCINCLNANIRFKREHNVNHTASDKDCPSFSYQIKILKGRIDYNGCTNGG